MSNNNKNNKLYPDLHDLKSANRNPNMNPPTKRRPLRPTDYRPNQDEDSQESDISSNSEESENEECPELSRSYHHSTNGMCISNYKVCTDLPPHYHQTDGQPMKYHSNFSGNDKRPSPKMPSRHAQSTNKVHHEENDNGNNLNVIIVILAFIGILLGVAIYNCGFFNLKMFSQSQTGSNSPKTIKEKIASLKEDFPLQPDDTWFELESAITTFFEKSNSISLILRYENDINIKTPKCLVNKLIKALELESMIVERNYKKGELIDLLKHRPKIGLIIENLQDFPTSMVQDFHFICDPETAMGNTFMCVFILKVKKNSGENSFRNTERILTDLWIDSLGPEKTAALITRLNTNNVDFRNENQLPQGC